MVRSLGGGPKFRIMPTLVSMALMLPMVRFLHSPPRTNSNNNTNNNNNNSNNEYTINNIIIIIIIIIVIVIVILRLRLRLRLILIIILMIIILLPHGQVSARASAGRGVNNSSNNKEIVSYDIA